MMTYYDSYDRRLDEVDRAIIRNGFESVRKQKDSAINCSMFASLAGSPQYGRGTNMIRPGLSE